MSQHLLTPHALSGLALPNRTVMAPMTRSRATADGLPTALTSLYYAQRASAGLIVSESIYVSPAGKGFVATAGLHTDAQQRAWSPVTGAVHAAGGRIYAQLVHVGRITHESLLPEGVTAVAPSAVRAAADAFTAQGPAPAAEPRALDAAEIPGIVADFVAAARRAVAAGFDGVELHAANGFLLHQFLAAGSNHREDAYGGSVDNRVRLTVEVARAVAAAIGADRVGVRVSPGNPLHDMAEPDADALYPALATALNTLGIAYLHVLDGSAGWLAALRPYFTRTLVANGAEGGAPTDEAAAEKALAAGADLVAFGRAFLANPDLPVRLALGAPLGEVDYTTAYGGDHRGYTDYPTLDALPTADGAAA